MHVSTLNSMLFVSINGPNIDTFQAEKYAEFKGLKRDTHSAEDKPTGKKRNEKTIAHHTKLFS